MTRASDHVLQLNDIDDFLASVQHLGEVLYMASADSCFTGDARNVVQTVVDAMGEKVVTARELLDEMKGRLS